MVMASPAQAHIELLPRSRFELNQRRHNSTCPEIWLLLDAVTDPEIPVITIWELGVLQDVTLTHLQDVVTVEVALTPTYTGCPALAHMTEDVEGVLHDAGYTNVNVIVRLSPAWTTDWISPATKTKLCNYGIAPPDTLACPQCNSSNVEIVSEFGSTACKALYRCTKCAEPFDYFKSI